MKRCLLLISGLLSVFGDDVAVDAGSGGSIPIPKSSPGDPHKLLATGEREFRAKSYETSVRLLSEALALTNGDTSLRIKVLYARHKSFMSQQKLPMAISDLSSVIELDSNHVLAHLQRANLELMTGKCAEAVADYKRVLILDSGKKDAHSRVPHASECAAALERAEHAKAQKNPDALRQALTDATAEGRATSAPNLLAQRAQAFVDLGGEENVASALADLARVLKMDPNNVGAYALRGRALMLHGDFGTGA